MGSFRHSSSTRIGFVPARLGSFGSLPSLASFRRVGYGVGRRDCSENPLVLHGAMLTMRKHVVETGSGLAPQDHPACRLDWEHAYVP